MDLTEFLPPAHDAWANPQLRRSALASSFVAALELARTGKAEIAQDTTFGPLRLRGVRP
jgi:segregation and condensation protein A